MKDPRTVTTHAEEFDRPSIFADYLTLTKPRIGVMIFYAGMVGARLAPGAPVAWSRAVEAGLYIAMLGAGASALNQVLERDTDRLMERTFDRPLPSGRIRSRDALIFGGLLCAMGTLGLALGFNVLGALLGLATLVGYALIYTPMKRYSSINTVIGAVPGAMPPLIGYAALAGAVDGWGFWLFALLFVWQFPHFMAIAWLWRDDYARAGLQMLPSLPNRRGHAGRQALVYSLLLVPISVLPTLHGEADGSFALVALVSSFGYVGASLAFALRETDLRAKVLLYASLVYLPVLFTAALLRAAASV